MYTIPQWCWKSIPKEKNVFKIITYHPYPPKYCIPKIKMYMHLNSKRSILRNSLISLACIFLKKTSLCSSGWLESHCLLPRLRSSIQSSSASPCRHAQSHVGVTGMHHCMWLTYAFVFHPLWWRRGCWYLGTWIKAVSYLPTSRHTAT